METFEGEAAAGGGILRGDLVGEERGEDVVRRVGGTTALSELKRREICTSVSVYEHAYTCVGWSECVL